MRSGFARARRPVVFGAALACAIAAGPARAQGTGTAADIVPADCAAFSSTLRLRQQFDRFVASPAAKKNFLPLVQAAWAKAREAAKNDPKASQAFDALELPPVQQGLGMMADLVGQEVFVYGEAGWADYIKKLIDGLGQTQMQSLMKLATSGGRADTDKLMAGALVDLVLSIDQKLPGVVFGFKPTDPKMFADLIAGAAQNAGALPVPSETVKVGGDAFVVVKLDGKMIPLTADQFVDGLEEGGIGEDKAKELYEWVRKQTLHVALGVKAGYVVLSFGGDAKHLEKLGKDPLAAAEPFSPALKHLKGPQPVAAVGYTSLAFNSIGSTSLEEQQANVGMLAAMLNFVAPELASPVGKELRSIVADMHAATPIPSETVAVTLLNRGYESFGYTRGLSPAADYSKPLAILGHAGGEPVLAAAWGALPSAPGYAKLAGYASRFYGYGKGFAMKQIKGEAKADAAKVMEIVEPLFEELHAVTEKKLLPAIDGGQGLFVLDMQCRAKQFGEVNLPKPMPVPEMSLAFAINDGDLLKDAVKDYAALVAKGYAKIVPLIKEKGQGDNLPDQLPIPAPDSKAAGDATAYFYNLPVPLDAAILPHVEVGKKFLSFGSSPSLAGRMRTASEIAAGQGLVKLREPSSMALAFRTKNLYAAVAEWYGFAEQQAQFPANQLDGERKKFFDLAIGSAKDLFPCLKGSECRIHKESKYQVLHSWTHLDDGQ